MTNYIFPYKAAKMLRGTKNRVDYNLKQADYFLK